MNKQLAITLTDGHEIHLSEISTVKVVTNDAVVDTSPKDFQNLGRAEQYTFLYEGDQKLTLLPKEIQSIHYSLGAA